MTFEQALMHCALWTLWQVVKPQVPGIAVITGFTLGMAFIWSILANLLRFAGISFNVNEGKMPYGIKPRK